MYKGIAFRGGLWKSAGVLMFALVTQGCSTNNRLVHSNVEDRRATLIAASVVVRPESWRSESERRGQGGIEFGYEHQSGTGTQLLKDNQYLQYTGATQIVGPQRVNHDVTIDHGHIAYNRLFSFGDHFQLEPAIGLAYDAIKATAVGTITGSNSLSLREDIYGITVGVTPRWNFNRFIGVELPVRLGLGYATRSKSISFFSSHDNGITSVMSPALVFHASPNVSISAGYTMRSQNVETDLQQSNIDTSFDGAYAAFRVTF